MTEFLVEHARAAYVDGRIEAPELDVRLGEALRWVPGTPAPEWASDALDSRSWPGGMVPLVDLGNPIAPAWPRETARPVVSGFAVPATIIVYGVPFSTLFVAVTFSTILSLLLR